MVWGAERSEQQQALCRRRRRVSRDAGCVLPGDERDVPVRQREDAKLYTQGRMVCAGRK